MVEGPVAMRVAPVLCSEAGLLNIENKFRDFRILTSVQIDLNILILVAAKQYEKQVGE